MSTCRYVDMWTCRDVDLSTCRYGDVSRCRYVDMSICTTDHLPPHHPTTRASLGWDSRWAGPLGRPHTRTHTSHLTPHHPSSHPSPPHHQAHCWQTPTNHLAVQWFLNECWQAIRLRHPQLRLRLIGMPPGSKVNADGSAYRWAH